MEQINFTTGSLFLDCFIGGLLGILCHIFFLKLPAHKRRAKKANTDFNISQYFKDDWIPLGGSLLTVIIGVFIINELLNFRPSLLNWVKFFFIFVGYTGSSVLQGVFSKTNDRIEQVIDVKTDKADEKET